MHPPAERVAGLSSPCARDAKQFGRRHAIEEMQGRRSVNHNIISSSTALLLPLYVARS